jgi:hypothetical protein
LIPTPQGLDGADHRLAAGVHVASVAAEEQLSRAPPLSYLLDDMWSEMVERGDGVLRTQIQIDGNQIEVTGD